MRRLTLRLGEAQAGRTVHTLLRQELLLSAASGPAGQDPAGRHSAGRAACVHQPNRTGGTASLGGGGGRGGEQNRFRRFPVP